MMSLTFGLFTQVSGSGPLGPLVSYKQKNSFSENQLVLPSIRISTGQVATFCYPHFKQVANGVFRGQICYLLLLISNPGLTSVTCKTTTATD